jgi:hypothetical protein
MRSRHVVRAVNLLVVDDDPEMRRYGRYPEHPG